MALLPKLGDPLMAPFWTAAKNSQLVMQRCQSCHHLRWPPTSLCPECLSSASQWDRLSGKGVVWSFAVYERAFHPDLRDIIPYTVLLVELEEGPLMISSPVEESRLNPIGAEVVAAFVDVTPEVTLVKFRPVGENYQ